MKPIVITVEPEGGRIPDCIEGMHSLSKQLDCGVKSVINDVVVIVYPYSDLNDVYDVYLKEYRSQKIKELTPER